MVDASIQDPPELLLNRPPSDTLSPLPPPSPAPSSPSLTVNGLPPRPSSPLPSPNFPPSPGRAARRRSANAPTKHLRVEDRPFFAVSATLDVLVLLIEYLKVIVNLPLLVTDTMSRVIELLKSFNSRTCQVVLGAGAMRSAGLKNITAKHLGAFRSFAMCAQVHQADTYRSSCVAVTSDHDLAHPVRSRGVPQASQPETGGDAHRVRQAQAGMCAHNICRGAFVLTRVHLARTTKSTRTRSMPS